MRISRYYRKVLVRDHEYKRVKRFYKYFLEEYSSCSVNGKFTITGFRKYKLVHQFRKMDERYFFWIQIKFEGTYSYFGQHINNENYDDRILYHKMNLNRSLRRKIIDEVEPFLKLLDTSTTDFKIRIVWK